jgi:predicted nucleic acid-binding protein
MELADTSVWARKAEAGIRQWFAAALEAGEIAVCDMVALEILHSARDGAEFRRVEDALLAVPWIRIDAADWSRARDVYCALADKGGGHQRSVGHPDLLIAAAAERAGIPLVHYDSDYEAIAGVTGQEMRWVAPRGTL